MASIHALIGVGEALITLGAISFVYTARKDLLKIGSASKSTNKGILIGGSVITIILAILSPMASSHPDGLEWVAEKQGFLSVAQDSIYNLIPDYVMLWQQLLPVS
jgi:cobalt/nickel transport system permease protein